MEFPYSNNAGYFKLGIEKIVFTGGSTPFVWFGGNKTDNKFDGTGIGGQLIASLYQEIPADNIVKISFQEHGYNRIIGEDSTAPYILQWRNVLRWVHDIKAVATTIDGTVIISPIKRVQIIRLNAREDETFEGFESIEAHETESATVYPNPAINKITIRSSNSNAFVVIRDVNGAIVYQDKYGNLHNGEADISFLSSGMYFLKLEDDTNPSAKVIKLIKQ